MWPCIGILIFPGHFSSCIHHPLHIHGSQSNVSLAVTLFTRPSGDCCLRRLALPGSLPCYHGPWVRVVPPLWHCQSYQIQTVCTFEKIQCNTATDTATQDWLWKWQLAQSSTPLLLIRSTTSSLSPPFLPCYGNCMDIVPWDDYSAVKFYLAWHLLQNRNACFSMD